MRAFVEPSLRVPALRIDALVCEARVAALPVGPAARALARQPGLSLPAKLALDADGRGALVAQILIEGASARARDAAREAANAALEWFESGVPSSRRLPAISDEVLGDLLGALPWPYEPTDDAFRVSVPGPAASVQVRVEHAAGGQLRASLVSSIPLEPDASADALLVHALQCNDRLRLARVSIGEVSARQATVTWDAIVPLPFAESQALREGIAAVVSARAATARALRALGRAAIAQAFIRLHGALAPESESE